MRFTNLTRRTEIGANSYYVEIGGKRIVLDAGMHPKAEGEEAMPAFHLLPPGPLDAVFVTHAHQDHIGSLPILMQRQTDAAVFMTEATRALSDVMLHNSVNVMMRIREEKGFANYPLFTHRAVDLSVKRWQARPLGQPFTLDGERVSRGETDPGVTAEFFDAGHILGSVGVLIRGEGRSIFYTGDVNFEDQTLSRAAAFPREGVDVLVVETTRGDSPAPEGYTRPGEADRLVSRINAVFERGGCVLIPLFALGKTQEILVMLLEQRRAGKLRNVPIYIGGLSTKLTEIYDRLANSTRRHHAGLQILDTIAPFVLAGVAASETPIKSNRIYALSSGMMTEKTGSNAFARRILEDPLHAILFVGYSDPQSPAGQLRSTEPEGEVVLDGEFPAQRKRCEVEAFTFSAHGTRESIRQYVRTLQPKKVVLVHGDPAAVEWFQSTLRADLPGSQMIVPPPGVEIEL